MSNAPIGILLLESGPVDGLMEFLNPGLLGRVGFSALGLLVLGWLATSFMAEGKARSVLEWATATCMFVALLSLFLNLVRHAVEDDSLLRMIVFGLLALLFTTGTLVSAGRTIGSLARPARPQVHI